MATNTPNLDLRKIDNKSELFNQTLNYEANFDKIDNHAGSVLAQLGEMLPIKGTKQIITFNLDGSVQKIEHKDSLNTIVRLDSFTYSGNLITEVRTMGAQILTFIYNLDTFETEVI